MFYGVFVGIDEYRDTKIRPLSFAASDASAMHRLISDNIKPDELSLHLFLNQDATRTAITKTVGEELVRRSTKDDFVLFYFAGHGSPETTGATDMISRYLVMHDTEYENIFATGIDMERDLTRLCERLRCKWLLFVLDACFGGRAGGRTFEGPELKRMRESAGWRGGRYDLGGHLSLRDLDMGEGRIMLTACDDDQVALEDLDLGHGLFTHCLINALTEPVATKSRTIGIGELYERVVRSLRERSKGRQIPILNGRAVDPRLPIFSKPEELES